MKKKENSPIPSIHWDFLIGQRDNPSQNISKDKYGFCLSNDVTHFLKKKESTQNDGKI